MWRVTYKARMGNNPPADCELFFTSKYLAGKFIAGAMNNLLLYKFDLGEVKVVSGSSTLPQLVKQALKQGYRV